MAQYIYDMGFDFNDVQRANTLSYLRNGLLGANGAQPNFNPNDTVQINAFNLTANATTSGYSIIGGLITFTFAQVNPSPQSSPYPFSSSTVTFGNNSTASVTIANGSATIQIASLGTAPRMAQSSIFVSGSKCPSWEITSDSTRLTIAQGNSGHFLMTVALIVQQQSVVLQRTFVVDPEMIVAAPIGNPDPQGLLESSAIRR